MTRYDAGDVVLVRFPFTDLSATKKRPALVLSPVDYMSRFGDVVVLALTSQRQPHGEFLLSSWKQAGLPKPTWCKPLVATVASTVVDRRVGRLAAEDTPCIAKAIKAMISESLFG